MFQTAVIEITNCLKIVLCFTQSTINQYIKNICIWFNTFILRLYITKFLSLSITFTKTYTNQTVSKKYFIKPSKL